MASLVDADVVRLPPVSLPLIACSYLLSTPLCPSTLFSGTSSVVGEVIKCDPHHVVPPSALPGLPVSCKCKQNSPTWLIRNVDISPSALHSAFQTRALVLGAARVQSFFQLHKHHGLCLMPRSVNGFSSSATSTILIQQLPKRYLFKVLFLLACPTLGFDLNSPSYRKLMENLLQPMTYKRLDQVRA